MKRFSFLFLVFALAATLVSQAAVTRLPAEDRAALLKEANFHEVHAIHDLPPSVVALVADGNGHIAEPGASWQATDAIDPSRPLIARRLIWGAIGGDYYVVHSERGGFVHTFHILVAVLPKAGAKPKVIWQGTGPGPGFNSYKAFLDGLRANKLTDDLN
jgi:hypothetical protein